MITFDVLKNRPHHVPELGQLMIDEWGKYYPNSSWELMVKWLHKTARETGLPLTMLALDGGKLAGCAMLQNHELYREKGIRPWLGGLLVKKEYQNQGIGEQLTHWSVDYVKSLGFQKLYLLAFDEMMVEWYESLGWHVYKREKLSGHLTTVMGFNVKVD